MALTKIQTAGITDDAVTAAKIADGTVVAAEIGADAVGASELADDSVASANIIDGAIVNADVNASAAIAASKISGLATSATTDTTSASNISSGTLPIARITNHLNHTNIVINGGFDVWQRGVSLTSSSYYNMYADRWMGDAYNNTGNTISRQLATASEPFYRFLRFQRDASNSGTGMRRVGTSFESQDTKYLCGQEVTLSFYARKGANWSPTDSFTSSIFIGTATNEAMNLGQGAAWTGYAQQTQSNTLTTSWQRFTHTVTLSASAQQVGIQFIAQAASGTAGAADYFDLGGVKLELGGVATPFISPGFGPEITRCQRYYCKSYPIDTTPGSNSGAGSTSGLAIYSSGSQGLGARWPGEMRTTPTVTLYTPGGTSGNVSNTANNANISATAGDAGSTGFQYVSGSLPTGDNTGYRFHWVADAEM